MAKSASVFLDWLNPIDSDTSAKAAEVGMGVWKYVGLKPDAPQDIVREYENFLHWMENAKNIAIDTPKLVNISEIAPDLKLEFSEQQFKMLQGGMIPEAMEDKWFIYFENNSLYFHRSWTGYQTFRAEIIKEKGDGEDREYKIKAFYVERNQEKYRSVDDEYDLNVLLQLIFWGLLRLDVREFFFDKYGSGERGAVEAWSTFGRLHF